MYQYQEQFFDPYGYGDWQNHPEYMEERQIASWFPNLGGALQGPPGSPPPFSGGTMQGPPFPSGGPMQGPPGPPPSFGPPSQGPGGPGAGTPPTTPPPQFVPAEAQQATPFAVDPGSIRRCLFRFTYVWLRNRQQFWFYPMFVGRNSVSGYRWTGFRWIFFGVSLREIRSFTCV